MIENTNPISQNETTQIRDRPEISEDFYRVPPLYENAVSASKASREEKLERIETLKPEFVKKLKNSEKEFDEIQVVFAQYQISLRIVEEEENPENITELLKTKLSLELLLNKFTVEYQALNIDPMYTDSLYARNKRCIDFWCIKEIIYNTITNRTLYEEQVTHFVKTNIDLIVNEFKDAGLIAKHLTAKNSAVVEINQLSKDETHNGGKKPLKISFELSDGSIFSFVSKPRNSKIDRQVIETFRRINNLDEKNQSQPNHPLPTYTIIIPEPNHGWQYLDEVGEISLWEFIEGEKITVDDSVINPLSPKAYIKQQAQGDNRQLLLEKLKRMDAILSEMGITDLTHDNVIIQNGFRGESPSVVPIDLEVRDLNEETYLGTTTASFQLQEEELECIKQFNAPENIQTLPFRVIPIGTQRLAQLCVNHVANELLANVIMESLIERGYEFTMPKKELQNLLLRDTLNFDVPYLTEYDNKLYFGLVGGNIIIGGKTND